MDKTALAQCAPLSRPPYPAWRGHSGHRARFYGRADRHPTRSACSLRAKNANPLWVTGRPTCLRAQRSDLPQPKTHSSSLLSPMRCDVGASSLRASPWSNGRQGRHTPRPRKRWSLMLLEADARLHHQNGGYAWYRTTCPPTTVGRNLALQRGNVHVGTRRAGSKPRACPLYSVSYPHDLK